MIEEEDIEIAAMTELSVNICVIVRFSSLEDSDQILPCLAGGSFQRICS